jgi:hypothetical protein
MKNLIVTRYHGPTDTRGSRISVRGFVPGSGIVRKAYSYEYGARNAHEFAASRFLGEFYPGCIMEEVRMPEDGRNATGNSYLVRDPLPHCVRSSLASSIQELRESAASLEKEIEEGRGNGSVAVCLERVRADIATLEGFKEVRA